ncbi:calponin homology domain-containing protein [Obelidium mucronatum]|nr:calponin homology domain-containing protein [Obelidium mucronatum]
MGSRTELLAWANDLSQLGLTKIEQCGSGIVQCVIMDSIYRDVPLKKVKFTAKHEYEYIANFKVLQSVFDKHKIENNIPIEKLAKCKMQDNLEFMQWMKKFWDQYYPGILAAPASPTGSTTNLARSSGTTKGSANSVQTGMKKTLSTNSVTSPVPKSARTTVPAAATSRSPISIEKEREFYFTKLREIELFVQEQMENPGVLETGEVLEQIQSIMYKTEDGFEIPDAVEVDEEETF